MGLIRLRLYMQHQHPIWVPVRIPETQLLIQLPAMELERQQRKNYILGPLSPHERLRRNSCLPVLTQFTSKHSAIWEVSQQMEELSLFLLSLCNSAV